MTVAVEEEKGGGQGQMSVLQGLLQQGARGSAPACPSFYLPLPDSMFCSGH